MRLSGLVKNKERIAGAAMVGDRFVFDAPPDVLAREIEDYRSLVVRNPLMDYLSDAKFGDFKAFAAGRPSGR